MVSFKNMIKKQAAFFVVIPAVVWQILFLYIPLFLIVSASFFKRWQTFNLSGFTLHHYMDVIKVTHMTIIGWSLVQALIVTLICLFIGYPVAYFFALKMRRWKTVFLFFLTLPFWTNFLVQSYAWFFILEKQGLINWLLLKLGLIDVPLQLMYRQGTVILIMVYCYLPFMMLPLYNVLEKFNLTFLEAAYDLGATPRKTFFSITLPLTMSGIRNGVFLVFVPAFGEYVIPAVVGGNKHEYVGSLISDYFLQARNPALGGAFTVTSCLSLLLVIYLINQLLSGSTKSKRVVYE
jgi:spermidine/putrescine transport system permease protein